MATALLPRTRIPRLAAYCPACGRVSAGGADACASCHSSAVQHVDPIGEIYSYTIVNLGAESFVLALVELSAGQLVTARIVNVDRELSIGLPVELRQSGSPSGAHFFTPLQVAPPRRGVRFGNPDLAAVPKCD